MNLKTIILIVCLAGVCTQNNKAQTQKKASGVFNLTDPIITLERSTNAFENAHAYKLTIYENGTVIYKAEPYNPMPIYAVKQKGKQIRHARSKLSQPDIKQLLSEFDAINFLQLKDKYSIVADGCGKFIEDQPSVKISLNIKSKKKSIYHSLGCVEDGTDQFIIFPRNLYKLEEDIDRVVGTKRWIK